VKILVVDDDRVLADLVDFTLRREGFQVIQAHDGAAALRRWQEEQPDLLILDVNLPHSVPKLDGFIICQRIREEADTPIILLTVREDEDDIVRGLQLGADDYILKPFQPRQLLARVQAVLRRTGKTTTPDFHTFGDLTLYHERREVQIMQGERISLTTLENRLLAYLMLHAGHILSYEDIINHIWGPGGGNREMLRQLVRRLRSKIEPEPSPSVFIENLPGVGYGLSRIDTDRA
jgi:DNA-binding response OmpR family regulator